MIEHLNWFLAATSAGVGITTAAVVYLVVIQHPRQLKAFHEAFLVLLATHTKSEEANRKAFTDSEAANRKAFDDRSAQDRTSNEKTVEAMHKISVTQTELSTLIRSHGPWDGINRRE